MSRYSIVIHVHHALPPSVTLMVTCVIPVLNILAVEKPTLRTVSFLSSKIYRVEWLCIRFKDMLGYVEEDQAVDLTKSRNTVRERVIFISIVSDYNL